MVLTEVPGAMAAEASLLSGFKGKYKGAVDYAGGFTGPTSGRIKASRSKENGVIRTEIPDFRPARKRRPSGEIFPSEQALSVSVSIHHFHLHRERAGEGARKDFPQFHAVERQREFGRTILPTPGHRAQGRSGEGAGNREQLGWNKQGSNHLRSQKVEVDPRSRDSASGALSEDVPGKIYLGTRS